jgi:transketolase
MDVTSESSSDHPMLVRRAAALSRPVTQARRMADAIRALTIDAAIPSESNRAGRPMGMADAATALWTRFHKFDAADPRWPDRDRFVLCAGYGGLLLYALIHLTGHDGLSIDDIREFHKSHAPSAGHPDYDQHPAVEAIAGAAGQGLATAVGMALAERNMASRFGKSLVDHRTWVIASDADLMDGISHEAASLAGRLGLSKLAVLYADHRAASGDGQNAAPGDDTDPSYGEDVLKRFTAYGWATKRVDGHDPDQINAALSFAVRSRKPTLIACRTNPSAALTAEHPRLVIENDLKVRWHAAGARGATARRSWLKRLARHAQRGEFERVIAGRLPDTWHEAVIEVKQQIADDRPMRATATASQHCLEMLVPVIPELIGGSAGPAGSFGAAIRGLAPIGAGHYGGRSLHHGVREHGMAATANGMALHGGIIPYIATGFAFSDYLRPALRLAAIMRQRVICALTEGTDGLAADGPSHPPIEQLAGLRAMPNLHVFRPADTMETAECWELALRRTDGPSLLVLSQQSLPAWRTDPIENRCARGGYVLAEADGPRQATVIATGSEVPIAMAAREKLAGDNIAAAVVSLPCWELFAQQDEAFRAEVLGGAPRVGIEAAGGFGWEQWVGPDGTFIGMTGFAAAAVPDDLYRQFGVTAEAVVAAVIRRLV